MASRHVHARRPRRWQAVRQRQAVDSRPGFAYPDAMRWRRGRDAVATVTMALVVGALLLAMLGAVVVGGLAIVGGLIAWLTS